MADQPRAEFLGLDFDRFDQEAAVEHIVTLMTEPRFSYVVTPNVDHIVQLSRQSGVGELQSAYRQAALCLCDSRILQGLAKYSKVDLPLVTGSDLTVRLLRDKRMATARIAVIGGDDELLDSVAQQLPRATFLHHVPPMGVRRNLAAQEAIAAFVESAHCGLALFAIGAPQSELICNLILRRGRATGVALCIGASLEFMIGAKQRAPAWMQRIGAEWLFRLLSEPRRLWRRYLWEGPRIFRLWWRWHRAMPRDRKVRL